MVNKQENYQREVFVEVRSRAERKNNQEVVRAMEGLILRMGRRKTVTRGFLTPEEKDFLDWALTSDAA